MPRRRLRRWLLNIHLYGGLLCSGYLLVYGASSLLFNHRFDRLVGLASAREWAASTAVPSGDAAPNVLARQVADELGIVGRIPAGSPRRDEAGELRFTIQRPGRSFAVRVDTTGSATVTERRLRPAVILLGLHDARPEPTSMALTSWWWYTHVTVAFLLYLAGSGVVLWVITRRPRGAGWPMLLGGTATIAALLAWLAR
jgi:hypothetical protein